MNKQIPYIITLAAIVVVLIIIQNASHAQTADPLLDPSVDQTGFPTITTQPVDQAVVAGSNAVLTVQAVNADSFQWQSNGVAMDGQTNSTLTLQNIGVNSAASYSCNVSQSGGDPVPTRAASLNVVMTASVASGDPITVFGTPKVSNGTQGTCPGHYAGYINYTKTVSQGWGWVPSAGAATLTASDGGGRTDTTIVYMGRSFDSDCSQTSVTIPTPPFSASYRFTIYFAHNVPTTNYPIVLTGFGP